MSSTSERPANEQTRNYDRAGSVVFLKTDAPFGGLSNMAGGFPLHVEGTRIYTSEALYQACRFPHLPEVQRLIIGQASPMTAKMKSKPYRKDSRPDWDRVRVKVMRWCLRVKLVQNWEKFSELLLRTADRPIVEESRRDDFWGAKPVDDQTLVGMNVLGRLLMELREAVKAQGASGFQSVEPLDIPKFLLFGRPIGTVSARAVGARDATRTVRTPDQEIIKESAKQGSLFDTPAARERPGPACITTPTPESTRSSELKPYPAMKDSGVPWLRQVPEHWEVRRLKHICRLAYGDALATEMRKDGVVPVYGSNGRVGTHSVANTKAPCIVVGRKGSFGKVNFSPEPVFAIDTTFFVDQRFTSADIRWLYYLLGWLRLDEVSKDSAVPGLDREEAYQRIAAIPPLPEQAAIVRFLDHVDRRIRRYIRAKQKQIKRLEELKAAIIHRAVTRGLDPNVRLKPSGVDWLGDVPEHWAIRRIASFSPKITNGWVGPTRDILRADGVPYIQSLHVKRGAIRFAKRYFVDRAWLDARPKIRLREGDVVVVQTGDIGQVACIPPEFDGAGCHALIIIRTNASVITGAYLDFVLRSRYGFESLKSVQTGALHPHLNCTWVREIAVPVPPIEEQDTILRSTSDATRGIDRAIESAESEASLLHEYRTRLIADVVTGKLDVREAAARLPDEAEEPEPLDEAAAEDEAEPGDTDEVPEETEA